MHLIKKGLLVLPIIISTLFLSLILTFNTKKIVSPTDALVFIQYPGIGSGSGTIIYSDASGSIIISAAHVCDAGPTPIIKIGQINAFAEVLKVNKFYDLCVLKTNIPNLGYVSIAQKYYLNERIFNVGCPHGLCYYKVEGFIGDSSTEVLNKELISISLITYPGASGSGVFNINNELLGIISAKAGPFVFIVPLHNIRAFLLDAAPQISL